MKGNQKLYLYTNSNAKIMGIYLLIFFLLPFKMTALDPNTPIRKYLLDEFVVGRGIPTNTITAIAQTPDGYLWVGTPDELVKYDGQQFETIDQHLYTEETDTRINCLMADRQGALWIGVGEGIVRYLDGTFNKFLKKYTLPKIYAKSMVEDMYGNIWIGTEHNYLYRYDHETFTLYDTASGLADTNIISLCADSKGNLWVGTFSEGLFKGYNGTFVPYDLERQTDQYPFTVYSIYEDRKGFIWVGTSEGLFRVKNNIVRHFTPGHGLSNPFILDILEDRDGNIWVGTRSGICRIQEDPTGKISIDTFFEYTVDEGHIAINCLFEDMEKSIWIGTVGYDMKRLREARFFTYSRKHSIPNFRLTLYNTRDGDTWVGSMMGELYRFKDGAFTRFLQLENPSEAAEITAIEEDARGNLWLGTTMRGLFQLKNGKLIHHADEDTEAPLPRYPIYTITRDSKNNLWITTYLGGLVCYRDGVFKTYRTEDGLTSNWVTNVHEDKNRNLWIGTSQGLTILPGGQWHPQKIKTHLPDTQISAIYEDENSVFWIGAYNSGIVRLKEDQPFSYTTADGLGSEYIFQIKEDNRGNLWMSSYDGVLKVSKKELNDFAAGKTKYLNCITFSLSDGMHSVLCSSRYRNSIIKTQTGELWFATRKGIAAINPDKIKINKTPPPVVLKRIIFNYQTITGAQSGKSYKGIKSILFFFTAPTFISQERVKFKYKLVGFDKDWILLESDQERMVHYENLPPGQYTFRVIACNSDSIWNNTGASFGFTLKPWFYETLTFKISSGLMVVLIVLGTYYTLKKYFYFHKIKDKYKQSTLDPVKTETYVQKLVYLLKEEKIYKDQQISLDSLAQKLSLQPRELSQLINEQLNKNFWGLINSYRMEEAFQLLKDSKKNQSPILDIAFEVGFNSKEAFNRVFKKHTGMTPSQYKKKMRK
ncbi:MAG: helix-turn-helix domain-containing protein [Candidatus Aminicenantes bacterium]|nr:MAG: helix-turn-helix domain-containing protein [Candidatus Aminicenantes bacterium]